MRMEARQISLTYSTRQGKPVTALDEMDFSVGQGETVGVLGPSGSGKSSLLYVLSGLKRPTTGAVFYDDAEVKHWNREESDAFRRKYFGFIFQRHYLISHLTILENVLLPLEEKSCDNTEKAMLLLKTLRLDMHASQMPGELSIGQRQLAAVARALVNRPQVVFADEPTASLDMDAGLLVMDTIASVCPDAAVVAVTHDVKMLRHAHRIVKLRDGRQV